MKIITLIQALVLIWLFGWHIHDVTVEHYEQGWQDGIEYCKAVATAEC